MDLCKSFRLSKINDVVSTLTLMTSFLARKRFIVDFSSLRSKFHSPSFNPNRYLEGARHRAFSRPICHTLSNVNFLCNDFDRT